MKAPTRTAENSELKRQAERDALRAKYDELLVALHGIGAALSIPEGDRSPYSITCGVLERVNRLAEIEAQEPVMWQARFVADGHWEACSREHYEMVRSEKTDIYTRHGYEVRALFTRPAPAQAVPDGWRLVPAEITEAMHAAAVKTIVRCSGNAYFPPRVWGAMIAAAPEAAR